MQGFVDSHRGASKLSPELVGLHTRLVGSLDELAMINREVLQAIIESATLGVERVGLIQNCLRQYLEDSIAKRVPVASTIASKRQRLQARHTKGPATNSPTVQTRIKLPPQHHCHLLHDLAFLITSEQQGSHKHTQRLFAFHKEPDKMVMLLAVGRVHSEKMLHEAAEFAELFSELRKCPTTVRINKPTFGKLNLSRRNH